MEAVTCHIIDITLVVLFYVANAAVRTNQPIMTVFKTDCIVSFYTWLKLRIMGREGSI